MIDRRSFFARIVGALGIASLWKASTFPVLSKTPHEAWPVGRVVSYDDEIFPMARANPSRFFLDFEIIELPPKDCWNRFVPGRLHVVMREWGRLVHMRQLATGSKPFCDTFVVIPKEEALKSEEFYDRVLSRRYKASQVSTT